MWLLKKIKEYLESDRTLLIIRGPSEIGKSFVVAKVCQFIHDKRQLAAKYFIECQDETLNKP